MKDIIYFEGVKYFKHQIKVIEESLKNDGKYGIFHEPGLGKTLSALTVAVNLYERKKINRVEIIPPASLIINWTTEIKKFVPEKYWKIFNVEFSHQKISRGSLPPFSKKCLLIIDESHNLSSAESERTKLMVKVADKFSGILSLTGTPKSNSALQLYFQSKFLGFDIEQSDFIDKYCIERIIKIPYFKNGVRKQLIKTLYNINMKNEDDFLSWFCTRADFLKTEDAIDLPEKNYIKKYYTLTKEQVKVKDEIKKIMSSNKIDSDDKIKASLHALMQLYSGCFLGKILESPKAQIVLEIIRSLGDKQVVIFTSYNSEVKLLEEMFAKEKITYTKMVGSQNKVIQNKNKQFFIDGECQVIIMNNKVGKEGHTLVNSHNMIFYSNDFDMVIRSQGEKRIHRIGQTEPAFYYDIICEGGLDEIAYESASNKGFSLKELYERAQRI
ncbi:MAG: DEAD/DEAH box helicase [Spirochaetes bacterium]|nr:MAG: DEAD/DEAH box helicase [Spirochaetota bacterium]